MLHRPAGHGSLHGIHGNGFVHGSQNGIQRGNETGEFRFRGNGFGSGTGGLRTDVDDTGTLLR